MICGFQDCRLLDGDFTLSLIDYNPDSANPENPTLKETDLQSSALVGLGAVGNAAVWALSRTPFLKGNLDLVDDEKIDLSNLQRYILAAQTEVGAIKIVLGSKQFQGKDLTVLSHNLEWGVFLRKSPGKMLNRVAVAVDSDTDRQAIQAALPK